VLLHISKLERKLGQYKKLFVNTPASVIDTLGEYARATGIKVVSLRPGQQQGGEIFDKYPFDLTIAADGFHAV